MNVSIEEVVTANEKVVFKLPKELKAQVEEKQPTNFQELVKEINNKNKEGKINDKL